MADTESTMPSNETPSLALYLGGLLVTLCGLLAVNSTLDDPGFGTTTLLLTLIGFGFSYGCRRFQVQPRLLQVVGMGVGIYVLYTALSQQWDWGMFVPGSMDKNDLRVAEVLAWGAVLWSWLLFSDDAVMFCCVPTVAMIGLVGSSNLNTEIIIYFGVFVLAATFLLIHQNYLLNRARAVAAERNRTRQESRTLSIQIALAALCAAAVMVSGTVLIVPAQAVFSNLSLAQAIRQLVQFGQGPGAPIAGLRYSDDTTLDIGTGEGWSSSAEVAMHVSPSDGQEHLWRGRTYDLYTGGGWESTRGDDTRALTPIGVTDDGLGRIFQVLHSGDTSAHDLPLTANYDVKGEVEQLYYAGEARQVTLDAGVDEPPHRSEDGRIDTGGRSLLHSAYTVQSLNPPDPLQPLVRAQLRLAGTNYPPDVRQYYLGKVQNSENDVTSTGDIAYFRSMAHEAVSGLPPDRHTPVDEAAAIRDWVANRCTYSLAVSPLPPDVDHVHDFLANTRQGYCDLFASSMAVLCRAQNIPARLATGFAPGEWDGSGYNLRAMDKHAWVEVYFPGYGWLPFDPTAGTRTDGTVPSQQSGRGSHWLAWWRTLLQTGPVPALLTGVIILILCYVLKTEVYDRWLAWRRSRHGLRARSVDNRDDPVRMVLGHRYDLMTRAVGRLGLPRRPSETPAEYAARAIPFLEAQEHTLGVALPTAAVQNLTEQFAEARYGDRDANSLSVDEPANVHALADFAAAAARARRVLLWRRVLRLHRRNGGAWN